MPPFQIYTASSHYATKAVPLIQIASDQRVFVAVFDGAGSWGYGMEAAAGVADVLLQRWQNLMPDSIELVASDINSATETISSEFRNAEFGCGFSGAAILLDSETVHLVAAGLFGIVLVNHSKMLPLFRPRMLIDQLMEEHHLSSAEVEPFSNVYIGPILGEGNHQALECSGPHKLPADHILLVAHQKLLRVLADQPPSSWIDQSAAALQQLGVQHGIAVHPVVVIRRPDP